MSTSALQDDGTLAIPTAKQDDSSSPGQRLKTIRKEAGLTQGQLAAKAGFKSSTMVAWSERGRRSLILGSVTTNALAGALGVAPDAFAIAPDFAPHETGLWHEGGIAWLHKKLIDLYQRDGLPGESRYPQISHPRLMTLQFEIEVAAAPKVFGRIRFLRRAIAVPYPGGACHEQECCFYHPDDVRESTIPFRSKTPRRADGQQSGHRFVTTRDDGKWSDKRREIYELPDGRDCGALSYLRSKYTKRDGKPLVSEKAWYNWRKFCPELGRPMESWDVDCGSYAVWLIADADEAIRRRTDQGARRIAPADNGEFQDKEGDLLDHPEYGRCISDEWAPGYFKEFSISARYPGYWRRHPHPALNSMVNGGKARATQTASLLIKKRRGGRRRRWFTCRDDLRTMLEWEKRLFETGIFIENPELANRGAVDAREIATRLKLNDRAARHPLGIVLAQFRKECPKSWTRLFKWSGRKREQDAKPAKKDKTSKVKRAGNRGMATKARPPRFWYEIRQYVYDDFHAWLDERDIVALAKQFATSVSIRGQSKAILFLHFILTHAIQNISDDKSLPKILRELRCFLANPPVGESLTPLPDGVRVTTIKALAKKVRIGWQRLLEARRRLQSRGVKIECGPEGMWRLAVPIAIHVPAAAVAARLAPKVGSPPDLQAPADGQESVKKAKARAKKKRVSTARTAILLLAFFEGDRRHLDMTNVDLARNLKVHPGTITRALKHRQYRRRFQELRRDHKLTPLNSEHL